MAELLATPLPTGCHLISYADDVALVVTGRGAKFRKAQKALDDISEKCNVLGLKISPPKTKAICIGGKRPLANRLLLQGHEVEWVKAHMYLGVWIDSGLSFKTEVAYLRERALARINVMRSLATREAGATSKVLRTFYVSAIRPLLDYASVALAGLPESQISKIDAVQNRALRVILGAPPWTLVANMQQETGILPVSARISQRLAAFTTRVLQKQQNSFLQRRINAALQQDPEVFPMNRWSAKLARRIRDLHLQDLILLKRRDVPVDGYVQPPPWESLPAKISIMATRRSAPLPQLRAKAVETMRAVTPENSVVYYTDGSVDAERRMAGAAFVTQDTRQGVRVLGTRCSMQAEGIAVELALTHALNTHQSHAVIITDSLSLIQSIHNDIHQDYVQQMTSLLFQIRSLHEQGRIVVLNWIPGHISLPGNEEADSEARKAAANHHMDGGIGVLPSRAEILTIATRTLTRREVEKHKLMAPMRPSALWYKRTSNYEKFATGMRLSRAQEVILHRLRLGYRCFWEIAGRQEDCQHCGAVGANTLVHYLTTCPASAFLRAGPATSPEGLQRRLAVLTWDPGRHGLRQDDTHQTGRQKSTEEMAASILTFNDTTTETLCQKQTKDQFSNNGFDIQDPPELNANRTLVITQVDPHVTNHTQQEIKAEIERLNINTAVTEVITLPRTQS
ncbi:uncharacterized protein LOC143032244 [Oratosquilla oratoria]|uniref:uncharacterized protein LOC143032244 n=1 Tax=Oratosquilla oratoria TaxID=337810 RepID=UPI003F76D07C